MAVAIARPKLEGNIAVGDNRQIGFAEFGDPQGRAIFWLHGTPGARRQIPMEARVYAEQRQIRLIGIDRPGIGSSTPYQYDTACAFAEDLRTIADTLGVDKFEVIGLFRSHRAVRRRTLHAGVRGGHARPGRRGRCAGRGRACPRCGRYRRWRVDIGYAGGAGDRGGRRAHQVGRERADPAGRRARALRLGRATK